MSDIAYPYRVVKDTSISFDGWYETGKPGRLQFRRSWDYMTDLSLTATIFSEPSSVFADAGIPLNRMTLNTFYETGAGAFRTRKLLRSDNFGALLNGSVSTEITISIPGNSLSGILILHTDLTLSDRFSASDKLVATIPGSRLWSVRRVIRLEGDVGRFPMAMVPFSKAFPNSGISSSPWFLQWNPNSYTQPLAGSALLYLNEECEWLKSAIEVQDPNIIAIMTADAVATMVVSIALNLGDGLENPEDLPAESAIRVLLETLQNVASGNSPEELLKQATRSIPLLRAKLKSQFMAGLA